MCLFIPEKSMFHEISEKPNFTWTEPRTYVRLKSNLLWVMDHGILCYFFNNFCSTEQNNTHKGPLLYKFQAPIFTLRNT